jgi:pimeloyl-ACP methyl ester carboxylesterase
LLALLATLLGTGCTQMVFQPMRQHVFDPRKVGVILEDRSFEGDDGTALHGWWLPALDGSGKAAPASARGTVVFLHGNAQNISTHVVSVHWLPSAGYNVYLYDYRGFGHSGGEPDYAWARRDLIKALRVVGAFPDAAGKPLFVFGQSLGGAIVLSTLGAHPDRLKLAGIVIEGAPSSLRRISRETLSRFWLTWPLQYPLSWLISDDRSPVEEIERIAPVPLLLAHSADDRVVPFHHGEALHAGAPPGTVWLQASGPHITAFANPGARRKLLEFLAAPTPTRLRADLR